MIRVSVEYQEIPLTASGSMSWISSQPGQISVKHDRRSARVHRRKAFNWLCLRHHWWLFPLKGCNQSKVLLCDRVMPLLTLEPQTLSVWLQSQFFLRQNCTSMSVTLYSQKARALSCLCSSPVVPAGLKSIRQMRCASQKAYAHFVYLHLEQIVRALWSTRSLCSAEIMSIYICQSACATPQFWSYQSASESICLRTSAILIHFCTTAAHKTPFSCAHLWFWSVPALQLHTKHLSIAHFRSLSRIHFSMTLIAKNAVHAHIFAWYRTRGPCSLLNEMRRS